MINNENYSEELKDLLTYMEDVLYKKYKTISLTSEHLILSILENDKCHANMILHACVSNDDITAIKDIYIQYLKAQKNDGLNENNKVYDSEVINILNKAEYENKITKSKHIGSEHIILSMLNPKNNFIKLNTMFNSINVKYDFIMGKCFNKIGNENNKVITPNNRDKKQQQNIINLIQPNISNNNSNVIEQFTININNMVKDGKTDKLIGRINEINKIIKVLSRRTKNNAILVGKNGCGKTSIINGIAELIINNDVPLSLSNKEIIMLDTIALVSGTHFRGMFEERTKALFDELKKSKKYILFIDDIHQCLKNSSKDKDNDISALIGNILNGGDVQVIATTNFKDYRNSIESNNSICRKFHKVIIEPTTHSETVEIINQNKHYYEEFHNVSYCDDVVENCVTLCERYITDKSLPDSAFDIIDLCGAHVSLMNNTYKDINKIKKQISDIDVEKQKAISNGFFDKVNIFNTEENKLKVNLIELKKQLKKDNNKISVTINDISTVISEVTSIPIHKLSIDDKKKIAKIDDVLKNSIIGQDSAINDICTAIKRNKIGLGKANSPTGVFLLLGKSGTGKTLLAKTLANEVFGDENSLIRFDMSEFSEKSSVSKLIGASAGYIGYENGGQLTEAIKNKPYCVLLFDEIEKANNEVFNLFLQLFDEGRLTDNSGQLINFRNTIIIMTSNVGAKRASDFQNGIGFTNNNSLNKQNIINKELKSKFPPEFINRIDKIVYFNDLTDDNLKDIINLELNKLSKRLKNIHYGLNFNENVIEYLHDLSIKEKEYGARPIIRIIEEHVENPITELLLLNEYENNYNFKIIIDNGKCKIE